MALGDDGRVTSADRQTAYRLLRFAVPLCAIAGAFAIGFAAFLTTGVPSVLCGIAWVAAIAGSVTWPRDVVIGGRIVLATGGAGILLFGFQVLQSGASPWELVAFWGSSALVLAYLMAYVGASSSDQRGIATVIAVVSLLLLTAMGLGQYVFVALEPARASSSTGFVTAFCALGVVWLPQALTMSRRKRSTASWLRRRGR